ncbi:MAG: hypothetical protein JNM79_17205 [Burkholderiales bacterium]|nr:hypothetical protein [Burkholderiales bacterium]
MKFLAICFSGRIGSGKSTLTARMSEMLGWPRASFGDYVRSVAISRNSNVDSRLVLANLGGQLIDELGWNEFCARVLSSAGWVSPGNILIDGIRHVEAICTLRRLCLPASLFHIHIDLSDEMAKTRQIGKGVLELSGGERHSTEIQVRTSLAEIADLKLPATIMLEEQVRQVSDFLKAL